MEKKAILFHATVVQDFNLELARLRTGKTKSQLIREAIDKAYGQEAADGKADQNAD